MVERDIYLASRHLTIPVHEIFWCERPGLGDAVVAHTSRGDDQFGKVSGNADHVSWPSAERHPVVRSGSRFRIRVRSARLSTRRNHHELSCGGWSSGRVLQLARS